MSDANHNGHRSDLRKRFMEKGLDSFADHEVLEFLLTFAITRKDTNPIAHALIDKYGSVHAALDVPYKDLLKIDGIGENSATLIKLIPQLMRRYEISKTGATRKLESWEAAGEYLKPRFLGCVHEHVIVVCLDSKQQVIHSDVVAEGTVNLASLQVRQVVSLALVHNATSVILAHNHPSGVARPSQEDRICTLKIRTALESVGVTLTDHIIVAEGDYISMMNMGFLERR